MVDLVLRQASLLVQDGNQQQPTASAFLVHVQGERKDILLAKYG